MSGQKYTHRKLYITPIAPPVDLITATMRLPNNRRVTVRVKKSKVKKWIYLFLTYDRNNIKSTRLQDPSV